MHATNSGCAGLKNVVVADRDSSLTLGSNGENPLFVDCPLDSLYLGGSIAYNERYSAGYSPFYRNVTLNKVCIAEGVDQINPYQFCGCTNLSSITIGEDLHTIGKYAFADCANLKSIAFGYDLQYIAANAFDGCTSMTRMESNTIEPPLCGNQALEGINKWECTLYVPKKGIEKYKSTIRWNEFFFIEENPNFTDKYFAVNYYVDSVFYAQDSVAYRDSLVYIDEPVKEGYTFSGWSEIPVTMPAHDVEVNGSFAINTYLLTYFVDGEIYKTDSIIYGSEIVPLEDLTKEGYTFSGWSEIPAVMPAHDVEVTGSFSVNYYQLTYFVDGEVYKTDSVAYGTEIVPEAEPTKEGHTFSGWSEIPAVMPAHDVEVTGSFSANTYYIIYKVEGEEYFVDYVKYGEQIVPVEEPEREGHTFSGWQGLPEDLRMPAHDVEVTGTFAVNYYLLTYLVDGEVYRQDSVAFGTEIVLMPNPEKPGYIFSGWSGYPEDLMMPAADVTIVGSFEVDGIQSIAAGAGTDTMYDVLGRKVQTQRKGAIYLQNGKKIMIR